MNYHRDRLEKVKLLVTYGADPNLICPPTASDWLAGHSPLLAAARLTLWEVCRFLLDQGADITFIGPQHLVFREFINRYAGIYAESGDTPAEFSTLLNYLNNGSETPPMPYKRV